MGIKNLLKYIKEYYLSQTYKNTLNPITQNIAQIKNDSFIYSSNVIYLDYTSQLIKFYYNNVPSCSSFEDFTNKLITSMSSYFGKFLKYNTHIYVFIDYKLKYNESI